MSHVKYKSLIQCGCHFHCEAKIEYIFHSCALGSSRWNNRCGSTKYKLFPAYITHVTAVYKKLYVIYFIAVWEYWCFVWFPFQMFSNNIDYTVYHFNLIVKTAALSLLNIGIAVAIYLVILLSISDRVRWIVISVCQLVLRNCFSLIGFLI